MLSDFTLENMTTRFSRLMAEYSSFQFKVKQRLTKLEKADPAVSVDEWALQQIRNIVILNLGSTNGRLNLIFHFICIRHRRLFFEFEKYKKQTSLTKCYRNHAVKTKHFYCVIIYLSAINVWNKIMKNKINKFCLFYSWQRPY